MISRLTDWYSMSIVQRSKWQTLYSCSQDNRSKKRRRYISNGWPIGWVTIGPVYDTRNFYRPSMYSVQCTSVHMTRICFLLLLHSWQMPYSCRWWRATIQHAQSPAQQKKANSDDWQKQKKNKKMTNKQRNHKTIIVKKNVIMRGLKAVEGTIRDRSVFVCVRLPSIWNE